MRLIDADKLKYAHYVQRKDMPIGYEGTQPIYADTDIIAYDIDKAPTVKAIPIEWLEKYIWSADTHKEKETLRKMYISWEKENANNN